ncbi:MAG TPA: DUF503 domain-containing protein [Candidatus Krumholzibacteria bacterium]|nr:DUF503 domain-containing protein [Candidatus Krumholzibacteria bacterium]
MIVVSLHVTLRLYASNSIKEKRQVVKSVRERLRNRFNVAVAEVGAQDEWRTAVLGLVTVASEGRLADREVDAITRFLDGDVRFEMIERDVEIH